MKQCFWCGGEADERSLEYIGNQRVWICDNPECHREFRNEYQAAYEEQAERLHDDWFGA